MKMGKQERHNFISNDKLHDGADYRVVFIQQVFVSSPGAFVQGVSSVAQTFYGPPLLDAVHQDPISSSNGASQV